MWNPTSYSIPRYGILPLIVSSLMFSLGALMIAIPLGIGCAAFISEMGPKRFKEILKPAIEILFVMTFVVNLISDVILQKYQEVER